MAIIINNKIPSSTGSPGGGGGFLPNSGGLGVALMILQHNNPTISNIILLGTSFIVRKSRKKNAVSKYFSNYLRRSYE